MTARKTRRKASRRPRLKAGTRTESLAELMAGLEQIDPGITARAQAHAKIGRPPKKTTRRGTREMRFSVPYEVAEKIVTAAEAEHRSISSWLALAAEGRLGQRQ